jgi:hypothetical protein
MQYTELKVDVPEALVADFASDPLSPYEKVLRKSKDPSWPLYEQLCQFLEDLPPEAIEAAYADSVFVRLHGRDERLARIRFAQEFLIDETARRRLRTIADPVPRGVPPPYSSGCLRGVEVDDELMVRLADFTYNGSTLCTNGFSFTVCPTKRAPNSTYWLLQSFYKQGVADVVRVRLDPFLWGASESFPQMGYKMLVYAKPVNWDGIGRLKKPHHGQMRPDKAWNDSELTEFCWVPGSDEVLFTCEELPSMERIGIEGARYLHAVYSPSTRTITHLDGALRIYTTEGLEQRHKVHLRTAGKMGLRRKIFRIDQPVDREAFSLVAQAFFIWNDDLAEYFRETLC